MQWLYLSLAIVCEVIATGALGLIVAGVLVLGLFSKSTVQA